jgi:cyclic pyranopterin phosphate synthase
MGGVVKNRIQYLRISLLNSCNLNCNYCHPQQAKSKSLISANYEKYYESIKLMHTLGVQKIRFTGGEPTLYKRLSELIQSVKGLDNSILTAITSNGVLLKRKAKVLAGAGLDSVNISIDTLSVRKFQSLTGKNLLPDVIDGIIESIRYIPKVKLNTVMIRNINAAEIDNLIKFSNDLKIDIRFIEYMPTKYNSQNSDAYISGDEIMDRLPYSFTPVKSDKTSAAKYYTSPDLDIKVGFIMPVSHPFCDKCNRIRLTSDGRLFGCLFSGESFNLFEALQNGHENASSKLKELIRNKAFHGCFFNRDNNDRTTSFINIGG